MTRTIADLKPLIAVPETVLKRKKRNLEREQKRVEKLKEAKKVRIFTQKKQIYATQSVH